MLIDRADNADFSQSPSGGADRERQIFIKVQEKHFS